MGRSPSYRESSSSGVRCAEEPMTSASRRAFFGMMGSAALAGSVGVGAKESRAPRLASLTKDAQPISAAEHAERIAKLQSLMQERKVAALLVESGPTLEYFTGIHWQRSERTTAALIPASGGVVVVTPFFEEPSVRETLKVSSAVWSWKEDESPFYLIAAALRDRAPSDGPLAVEATTRFFIVDQVSKAAGAGRDVIPGDELVRACRSIKSSAEIALMQVANDVTLAALKYVRGRLEVGMPSADIVLMMTEATEALGGTHEFSLVLLNEASAYPHGS